MWFLSPLARTESMSLKVAAQIVGFVNGLQTLFHPLIYYTTEPYIHIYIYMYIYIEI